MRTPKEIKADIQKLTEELKESQQAHTLKVGEAAMRKLNELGFKYTPENGWEKPTVKPKAHSHCFKAGDLVDGRDGNIYYVRATGYSLSKQYLTVSLVLGLNALGCNATERRLNVCSSKVDPIERSEAIKRFGGKLSGGPLCL